MLHSIFHVDMAPCSANASQKWIYDPFQIKAKLPGGPALCLDAMPLTGGLVLGPCTPKMVTNQWILSSLNSMAVGRVAEGASVQGRGRCASVGPAIGSRLLLSVADTLHTPPGGGGVGGTAKTVK